jgi:NADPH:quinone reductase-like Zn-dependent oxidoreductase
MKAVIYEAYGSADVLKFAEIATPEPADDQILVRIHAVSINGSDREALIGKPLYARMSGLRKPGQPILGSDIAGTVEKVGKNHTEFKQGQAVYGEIPGYHGGFAEYVRTGGHTLAPKPDGLTFEQAAAIPQGGVIAWRGIRTKGQVQPGQRVLVNGAGGSGGAYAIQLAKLYGAHVTGVDHRVKMDFMRSLGADHVIDYTQENFTKNGKRYDLILDLVGHHSVSAFRRALADRGSYYFVGGSTALLFKLLILGPIVKRLTGKKMHVLAVPQNRADLVAITEVCLSGDIYPPIDRQFHSLAEVPEALRYVSEGRAKGKVVISLVTS